MSYVEERVDYSANLNELKAGVKVIAGLIVIIYIIQLFFSLEDYFGLSHEGIRHFRLWQFVTYQFLHSTYDITHMLFNLITLIIFGIEIEHLIGTRRFVLMYLLFGILGGAGWLVLSHSGPACIGASGAIFGLMGAFGGFYPNRRVGIMFLPITMSARTMVIVFGVISLVLMYQGPGGNVAHAGHLAGGVAGFAYGVWLRRYKGIYLGLEDRGHDGRGTSLFMRIKLYFKRRRWKVVEDVSVPDMDEIDAILDKVHKSGLNSLSDEERKKLMSASKAGIRRKNQV